MSLQSLAVRDPLAAWAIQRTLAFEGGFSDHPADPGGATAHGVSLRYALQTIKAEPEMVRFFDVDQDGDVDRADIAGLSLSQAVDIYYRLWWRRGPYGELKPQIVAWKVFDIAVNTGPKRAAILLQKALCAAGRPVAIDAVIGPKTLAAVLAADQRDNGGLLIACLRKAQADFYRSLIAREPKLAAFERGWMRRAAA